MWRVGEKIKIRVKEKNFPSDSIIVPILFSTHNLFSFSPLFYFQVILPEVKSDSFPLLLLLSGKGIERYWTLSSHLSLILPHFWQCEWENVRVIFRFIALYWSIDGKIQWRKGNTKDWLKGGEKRWNGQQRGRERCWKSQKGHSQTIWFVLYLWTTGQEEQNNPKEPDEGRKEITRKITTHSIGSLPLPSILLLIEVKEKMMKRGKKVRTTSPFDSLRTIMDISCGHSFDIYI